MFYSILGHYLLAIIIMSFGAAFAQEQTGGAPECRVGQKLNFRYDDGRSFTRETISRENDLCVIAESSRFYYDKDWVLVRVVDAKGRMITEPEPSFPEIGERWLPFPLAVGKKWDTEVQGRSAERQRVILYQNSYTVLAQEEITVPAGTFNTFKIKHEQSHNATGTKRWGVRYFWYAPEAGYYVKRHWEPKESVDQFFWQTRRDSELEAISGSK